jgi:hypothetical protein
MLLLRNVHIHASNCECLTIINSTCLTLCSQVLKERKMKRTETEKNMKSKESVGSFVLETDESKRKLTIIHVLEWKENENNLFKLHLHVCFLIVSVKSFKKGI